MFSAFSILYLTFAVQDRSDCFVAGPAAEGLPRTRPQLLRQHPRAAGVEKSMRSGLSLLFSEWQNAPAGKLGSRMQDDVCDNYA